MIRAIIVVWQIHEYAILITEFFLDETSFLSLVTEPMNELESTDINENENKKQMEDIYVVTVEK